MEGRQIAVAGSERAEHGERKPEEIRGTQESTITYPHDAESLEHLTGLTVSIRNHAGGSKIPTLRRD